MSVDDSALYTGVDNEQQGGVFGNEVRDEATTELLNEQRQMLAELTPQLQDILDMIDRERAIALEFIASYVDATKDDDDNFKAELKAAGRYRKYLDELKTKFGLALEQTKGKL